MSLVDANYVIQQPRSRDDTAAATAAVAAPTNCSELLKCHSCSMADGLSI